MKIVTLRFTEEEHHKLKTVKDKTNLTWERFLLSLVKGNKFNKLKGGLKNGNKRIN